MLSAETIDIIKAAAPVGAEHSEAIAQRFYTDQTSQAWESEVPAQPAFFSPQAARHDLALRFC